MTTKQQRGLEVSRVSGSSSTHISHLKCPICFEVLWRPVACQSCENPFCSACIQIWLSKNTSKCPNRCSAYAERKCPPIVLKLLSELQITYFYQSKGRQQVISYEALDQHEKECDYEPLECPGCQSGIPRKDFADHTRAYQSIEETCSDCELVYKRGDANTIHTENLCLKKQLEKLRIQLRNNQNEVEQINRQLNQLGLSYTSIEKTTITFEDLPIDKMNANPSLGSYRKLLWPEFSYVHESYIRKHHPQSGCATCFALRDSPHVAYFKEIASINVVNKKQMFSLISLAACAAWNDNLKLTLMGYQNSKAMYSHTTTLLFGQPQVILLQWKGLDKVEFTPSEGTAHNGSGGSTGSHVIITQIAISTSE